MWLAAEDVGIQTNFAPDLRKASTANGFKPPEVLFRGIPENQNNEPFIFDMEDEIFNICKTFSIENKKQQKNLIETIKQNCRRIVREKTGKKPFTNINIARI